MTYSFTGHANDLWSRTDLPLSLEQLVRDASLVTTVSDYSARDLRKRFPASAGKVKRVYNGLDLQPFREAARRLDVESVWSGNRLIFSVGRLIEKKGFDDLIRACALLRDRGIRGFRCVIAGDGPLEDELRALIDELDVRALVELAGPKSQDDIVEYLEKTAVFALPCATEKDGGKDNLPTVIMEAMAAGVACASTDLAGVPEMVIDGETGRLVPERQPERFAEILAGMLSDREKTERMGARGEQNARALFAKEKTARQLRRYLVRFGLVRFDLSLARSDPALLAGYALQGGRRLRRLFRRKQQDRIG